jgi:hypothetical protein
MSRSYSTPISDYSPGDALEDVARSNVDALIQSGKSQSASNIVITKACSRNFVYLAGGIKSFRVPKPDSFNDSSYQIIAHSDKYLIMQSMNIIYVWNNELEMVREIEMGFYYMDSTFLFKALIRGEQIYLLMPSTNRVNVINLETNTFESYKCVLGETVGLAEGNRQTHIQVYDGQIVLYRDNSVEIVRELGSRVYAYAGMVYPDGDGYFYFVEPIEGRLAVRMVCHTTPGFIQTIIPDLLGRPIQSGIFMTETTRPRSAGSQESPRDSEVSRPEPRVISEFERRAQAAFFKKNPRVHVEVLSTGGQDYTIKSINKCGSKLVIIDDVGTVYEVTFDGNLYILEGINLPNSLVIDQRDSKLLLSKNAHSSRPEYFEYDTIQHKLVEIEIDGEVDLTEKIEYTKFVRSKRVHPGEYSQFGNDRESFPVRLSRAGKSSREYV